MADTIPGTVPADSTPLLTDVKGSELVVVSGGMFGRSIAGSAGGAATLDPTAGTLPIEQHDATVAGVPARMTTAETNITSLQAGQTAGMISFATKALMDADLAHADRTLALVTNDATSANNATYSKSGASGTGSWVLSADRVTGVTTRVGVLEGMTLSAAGRKNGWPDTFFRTFNLSTRTWWGKNRWYWNGGGASYSTNKAIVADSTFDGNALEITANGTTTLNGLCFYLSDISAVPGDTITIVILVTSLTGATFLFPGKFDAGTDASTMLPQISGLSDAGGASLAATSTPQRMTLTAVVPAGATRFSSYPYCSANAPARIVAVQMFKGAPSVGPNWPTLDPDKIARDYYRTTDEANIATLQANTAGSDATTAPAVKYAIDTYDVVTQSAKVVAVDVTAASSFARDLPFMAWGETCTPAGVSFNAINIVTLTRQAGTLYPWRTINVVVRTGATPQTAGAPVVAVGSITVNNELDTLSNVTILLKDPTTGLPITLTNASFSGGVYFIGIYALMANGSPAACGEPRATMANSAGTSYYQASTTNNPINGTWSAVGGNPREGVQQLLLTAPVTSTAFSPSAALSSALGIGPAVPNVVMPPTIYAVQGRECSVYIDNLFFSDASNWYSDFSTTIANNGGGQQQVERLVWVPTGALTGTLTLTVRDRTLGTVLTTKTASQVSCAASAHAGETPKVMVIGDSLTDAGVMTQTLLDIVTAGDVMGCTLVGTRGTAPNLHEGRAGYTVNDYTTVGRTFYIFTVAGVTVLPTITSTQWSNNGQTFTCQSYSISAGAGTITCSATGAPSASGTLTKLWGTGDATVAFSAEATAPGNPFWIGGVVNFPQFLTNNALATPDWVFIELGINDCFSQTDDTAASALADGIFTNLDILIASIKAAGAGVKVGLIIPPPPPSQDAFGSSYFLGQTRARYKRNILIWARELIARYSGQTAARIYLVPTNAAIDTVNNMLTVTAPINSRNATTIARHINGVHPGTGAYQQMADCIWAFMKCN